MSRDSGSLTWGLSGSLGIPGETLAGVNGHSSSVQSRAGLICTLKHLLHGRGGRAVTNTSGLAKLCDAELLPARQ